MLLPELQGMASSLGISGTGRMRKGELIAAIQERQGGEGRVPGPRATDAAREVAARVEAPPREVRAEVREAERPAEAVQPPDMQRPFDSERREPSGDANGVRTSRRASRPAGPPEPRVDTRSEGRAEVEERSSRPEGGRSDSGRADSGGERDNRRDNPSERGERTDRARG